MNTEEVVPEITAGQAFRIKHGYSRTFARNMKKNGVSSPDEYRKIRNKRKKERSRKSKTLSR